MDLKLVLSVNIVRLLGMNDAIQKSFMDLDISSEDLNVILDDNSYVSAIDVYFLGPKQRDLIFVLYDKLDSFTVQGNGGRLPILFRHNLEDKTNLNESIYLCNKKLIVNDLKQFRFGLHRGDMKDFFDDIDCEEFPLCFTFVILYS